MGIVKVSIFQKALHEGLNLATYKKIAALKSDFLLMPEYFFADQSVKDHKGLADKSVFAQDWLLKLNDSYRGIVLGGSVVRKAEDSARFASVPVISEGNLVDHYNKRDLSTDEKQILQPGSGHGIFILRLSVRRAPGRRKRQHRAHHGAGRAGHQNHLHHGYPGGL